MDARRARRGRIAVAVRAGAAVLALAAGGGTARAFEEPQPVALDGGPLGTLHVWAAADGYAYAISGAGRDALGGDFTSKSLGATMMNTTIEVDKAASPIGFRLQVGPPNTPTLGKKPDYNESTIYPTGPLFDAYVTAAPSRHVTLSAGHLEALEGFEEEYDWSNDNVLTTELVELQMSNTIGVGADYRRGRLDASVAFGESFDSGVWNTVQGRLAWRLGDDDDDEQQAVVFGATNFGRTGPAAHFYGEGATTYSEATVGYGPDSNAPLANSTLLGAFVTMTRGDLTVTPEIQYTYAKVDHRIGLDRFSSNLGAALFATWHFGDTPWSIGSWAEYFASNGPDAWFLNPRAKGVGVSVTPTWQGRHVFARADLGVLHLTQIGDGAGYGAHGTKRTLVMALVETGLMF